METLLERCLFVREWGNGRVENIVEYAGSGRARLFRTCAFNSFDVKESHQGDVKHLPTGARTLLLDADNSEVVVRGVNKFFDIEDLEPEKLYTNELLEMGAIWLQRKMAGFTVTLFSLDGESIDIATKHVVEGPHVDVARCVLNGLLSAKKQKRLASDLYVAGAAASCECISVKDDFCHPVPERVEYDNSLLLFSVHKRNDLREIGICFETMQSMAERWELPVVPSWRVGNYEDLWRWLQQREQWIGTDPDGVPLAEGYVVLFEIPITRLAPTTTLEKPFTVAPLRLKAKTVKYRVLRSLRSIVSGETMASPKLFHEVLALWSEHNGLYKCFRQAVAEHGVFRIYSEFETYVREQGGTRLRGSQMNIKRAFERLVDFTEKEFCARQYAPLHVMMLCGIPGVGKTTLACTVAAMAQRDGSPFRYVVRLSRDQIARDVAVREGIDDSSSKHKQRKLKGMVHHVMLEALNRMVSLSNLFDSPGLLIMDACNARVNTRRLWRAILPKKLESFRLIYVTCTNSFVFLRRLAERRDHDVLHSVSQAQAAVYEVKKAFIEPQAGESCVRLDTSASSAEDVARYVLALYGGEQQRHTLIYDYIQAEGKLDELRTTLVKSLVGSVDDGALRFLINPPKRTKTSKTVVVRLEISSDDLLRVASEAIMTVATKGDSTPSLWEKCKHALGVGTKRRAAVIEGGHSRWILGWLLDERDAEGTLPVSKWCHAFRERFQCRPSFMHVTLFYDDTGAELPPSALDVGSAAEVTLTSILLDRFALCCGARVTINGESYETQLTLSEAVPLHVTICYASHVKPSYSGMMFDLFRQWGQHNKKLEHARCINTVKRSRLKFFNFLKIRLETSVCVRGVVEFVEM